MTYTLVLLRHGESEWNAKNLFTGWVDVALSEKGVAEAKRAALTAGALGVSISGAGPTSFALCDGKDSAAEVARAMCAAYEQSGLAAVARVTRPDRVGARLEGEPHAMAAGAS